MIEANQKVSTNVKDSDMKIRVSKATQTAVIPFDDRVTNIIPHCRELKRNGHTFLLIPAQKEEMQLLRNLGYETPNTSEINYNWNGIVPFKAQIVTTEMLIHSHRAYVLNSMGTGKTLSVLFAYDYLRQHGFVKKMLVVAPLSTLTSVWEREVFARMSHYDTAVLHGTKAKRLKALGEDVDVYIINSDGPKVMLDELLAKEDIDVVVFDELATFRNKNTDRWRCANKLTVGRKYVWGLTGSPTPKAPTDAWAQAKLITPNRVPKWFKVFRDSTMYQVTQFKWLPKREANDVVFNAMQPAVRFKLDDCVDIPPTTYSARDIELSQDQQRMYKSMMEECFAEYKAGTVVASNEGVKISKLLQICSGFAYSDNGVIKVTSPKRYTELCDVIDGSDNKVIVFADFKFVVDELHKMLENDGYPVKKVYGDTNKTTRDKTFLEFQQSSIATLKVLVAHPQCMAHGLTLTSADTVVWYTPTHSLEIYEQANARIPRPGQKNHTHVIHFESSNIERRIYERLRTKATLQGALLGLFESGDYRKAS